MAIMATFTHCLVGTLQEQDYFITSGKIISLQVQDYLSKIIQDYIDISKCKIKMRVRCFDDFEGVPDQCLRLDLRFRN